MIKRRTFLLGASALGLAGAVGCSPAKPELADGALTVGLTYIPNVQFSAFYVGVAESLFAKRGLDVTLRHHGQQEDIFGAVLRGQEDVVFASADEGVVAAAQGNDIRTFATAYQRYPVEIVGVDRPEGANPGLEVLRGKTLGVPGHFGSSYYAALVALRNAGLSVDDVELVDIGFTTVAALTGAKVDFAMAFANNEVVQLEALGVEVTAIPIAADGQPSLVGPSLMTHGDAVSGEVLAAEYGPDQLVPVLTRPDGTALTEDDEQPEPRPFVRADQEKRFRTAQRNLDLLGRVNPLALEEFEAMSARHQFLAEQLDDLKRTRTDLLGIIADVDARVEQVFAEAYADVEVAFEHAFARLFPGGEGRLVLTEPGSWLTTGVDVEARPAGKKVKRLSLLSGGERSLVAVAFLVALFKARPSPFYILDEVEAALDDTNLGRLLGIYEELRENSQMLVITHQKRTMEIADALYGVTMREHGISTVISQRLRDG